MSPGRTRGLAGKPSGSATTRRTWLRSRPCTRNWTRSVRGDLYRLRSDKNTTGHGQRGPRYAVAIQSDGILLSTLVVAPTSASAQPAIFRPEIEMEGVRTRVLIDQMRAVDASRLGELAGRLDAAGTGEVDRAIRLVVGIL